MKRHYWFGILSLSLLLALATLMWIKMPRTVPFEQCSEVYQRFHNTPGIQASFIKDKQINDTLSLDMTLLAAEDTDAFVQLLKKMGKSEEYIEELMSSIVDENTRFVCRCPKGHPELPRDADNKNNDVMALFPGRITVVFFHVKEGQDIKDVFRANFHRTFNI